MRVGGRKKERRERGPLKIAGDVVIDELLHHPQGTFAAVMLLFATRATTTTGNHYHLIPTCRVFIIQSECNWSHVQHHAIILSMMIQSQCASTVQLKITINLDN